MKRIILILLICLLLFASFTGCNFAADNDDTETQEQNDNTENITVEDTKEISWNAVLYFSDKDAMYILKEERDIKMTVDSDVSVDDITVEQKAKLIIEELIKGSVNEGNTTSIPKSTEILSVSKENNTLVLDLSEEFERDHVGGSTGITMSMGPIVLSLTELEGVEQVSFKIEGKVLDDFKGHITLEEPFKREDFKQYTQ